MSKKSMKRRFSRPAVGALSALALGAALLSGCATQPPLAVGSGLRAPASPREDNPLYGSRPNVVYILADDLGYGDVGAYGQEKVQTPNIDALARNGLLFTQHYSGNTVCAPSRASLMTGLTTGHTSIRGNSERGGFLDEHEFGQMPLESSAVTVAEVLKKAGYTTALIGKWGLGGPDTSGVPNAQGFDHFFGYLDQKQAHNYYPSHLWRDGKRVPLDNRFFVPHPAKYGGSERAEDYRDYIGKSYAPHILLDDAKRFIATNRTKPFFLYFAPTIPHAALQVPEEALQQYRGRFPETPLNGGGYTPHPTPRAARAAMISLLDRQVGALVSELERQGLLERTIVIFTSDNGPAPEGGGDVKFFNAGGGLRGVKRDLYEGGIRAPMIASWPGTIAAGHRSDHLSAFWDVMPTLADLAGVAAPAGIDGLSFANVLAGQSGAPEHEFLYWEFHGKEPFPAQAIRSGEWKLLRLRPERKPQRIELYNLVNDRDESDNVAAKQPEVVRRLLAMMDSARSVSPVAGFNFDPSAATPSPYESE